MLRHSCGFYLADQGYDLRLIQDYLGHRDPKQTQFNTPELQVGGSAGFGQDLELPKWPLVTASLSLGQLDKADIGTFFADVYWQVK